MIGLELTILSVYGLFLVGVIVFQAAIATKQFGLKYILSSRDERHRLTGFAGRVERAAQNSIVAMVLFAPAIMSVQVQGQNSSLTLLAAQVFLGARVVYVLLYFAGIPYLRTLAFITGLLATVFLYFAAL